MKEYINQDNYIIRKFKKIKSKLYQAYLVPFFVDFGFRMGAAILASYVGAKNATIIAIVLLTVFRIKAIKDLIDVIKGLIETEKIIDPLISFKKVIIRDVKYIFNKNKIKNNSKGNIIFIIVGVIAPMMFDYFSMGIVARHGAAAAGITQIVDTILHISSLLILFSSVRKINEELRFFDENYYNNYKVFLRNILISEKTNIFSIIKQKNKIKELLNKEETAYDKEKIRRYLVDDKEKNKIIKKTIEFHTWEQFYLQFPNEKDNAERSIRNCDDKYMVVTKIIDNNIEKNQNGSSDFSRNTYSVTITKDRYNEFKRINGDNPIYKLISYSIKYRNRIIILDVYEEKFEGLNIARVKFENSKESSLFVKPKWFGREITNDPDYIGKHFKYTKN